MVEPTTLDELETFRAENDRLKADLRAVSQALTEALATPDRAARQALLERAAAMAKDAGEGMICR